MVLSESVSIVTIHMVHHDSWPPFHSFLLYATRAAWSTKTAICKCHASKKLQLMLLRSNLLVMKSVNLIIVVIIIIIMVSIRHE